MKIEKNNKKLVESKILVEADDIEVKDGGKEVTADIKVTKEEGAKGIAFKPATKKDALIIENTLTRALDRSLDDALYAIEEGNLNSNCNILVEGLPGSSKTATIKNWCLKNECNLYYLDAKNPDLAVLMGGAGSIDKSDPEHHKIKQAYSDALSKLDRPRSILFLDELNRQVKEYLRGSLLTLIAARQVAGDSDDGYRTFPNLLFTVAAINPPKADDKGATELNDAEHRRFYYHVQFDSEVASTKSFLQGYYDKKIVDYATDHPELTAKEIERINSLCLRQWIGLKLITNSEFKYTTLTDYLNSTDSEKGIIVCQSIITDLIDHSRGDLDRLKYDINASNLRASGKKMLLDIIEGLTLPNVDALRASVGKRLGLDLGEITEDEVEEPVIAGEEEDPDDVKPEDFDEVGEDDAHFDDDGSAASKVADDSAKDDDKDSSDDELEAEDDILSTVTSWS